MIKAQSAIEPTVSPRDRIIVALDVPTAARAIGIVNTLAGHVGAFKVGMQLFTAEGPSFVRRIVETGANVFLDLKFHDIPNTVANAAVEAARLGVWMLNVHASGGREMMLRTRDAVEAACEREKLVRPLLIGVTVLTSSSQEHLLETGVSADVDEQVVTLAKLVDASGFDGVVASPLEVEMIRSAVSRKDLVVVTPGIRKLPATNDDQKRVTTFGAAIKAGSNYAVIGRPITEADDMIAATAAIIEDHDSE